MISSEKIPQEHWEPWPWGWSPLGRWRAAPRGLRATPDKEEPAMRKKWIPLELFHVPNNVLELTLTVWPSGVTAMSKGIEKSST